MKGSGSCRDRAFLLTLLTCIFGMIECNELHGPPEVAVDGTEPEGLSVHGAEHGGEAGEHEFSRADFEVSCMLLGGVSWVMWLFFLVNYRDEDIRRYSWKIISITISIFLAVLLFQAINEIVLRFVERFGEAVVCLVQFVQCFVYVLILQYRIAAISGALDESMGNSPSVNLDQEYWVISDPLRIDHGTRVSKELVVDPTFNRGSAGRTPRRSVIVDQDGMEVTVQLMKPELEERNRRMKSSARLLAHMAGFAAINAGGTMQQLKFFSRTPLLALIPVVITEVAIIAVFAVCTAGRDRARAESERTRRGIKQVDMWSDEVFEAEVDISSLSLSFLVVQVIRFSLTGVLPHQDGIEVPEEPHSLKAIILLYGIGVAFLVVALLLIMRRAHATEGSEESMQSRIKLVCLNSAAMGFAWCVLWATRWACVVAPMINVESIYGRVLIALLLSVSGCAAVFVLDRIDDMHRGRAISRTNSQIQAQAISVLVNALGILIGFSWEHSFHGGVEAVASLSTGHREAFNFAGGLIIVFIMTPMWRRFILTKDIALQQLKDERDEVIAARKKWAEERQQLLNGKAPHTPGLLAGPPHSARGFEMVRSGGPVEGLQRRPFPACFCGLPSLLR